ncbi:MAG: chromate transporter [Spirochaetaceae bacterium]|jgi:chromate transporter|nr:chromate transporter [Spirochaetaceae bacterium]
MRDLFDLFFTFVRIGLVAFGGGYTIMPVIERELVNGKGWLTMDEVVEFYTIGQITPGVIAVNLASFIGYKRKKTPGALAATAGFILPGVTLVSVTALVLQNFSDIPVVQNAFAGIRLAIAALIARTVVTLCSALIQKRRGVLRNVAALAIALASFTLSLVWYANPVILIIAAGFAGLFCFRPRGPHPLNTGNL